MPPIPVTLGTAGILGLVYLALTVTVVRGRWAGKVMLGDGGGKPGAEALLPAIRAHGNFAEYVPLGLILLGGLELSGAAHLFLLILAAMLIVGRILHPFGLVRPAPNPLRAGGAGLTWAMILMASIAAVAMAI